MSIRNFTVQHDQLAASPDSSSSDLDANVDLVPLVGTVVFSAQFSDHRSILAPDYSPRPAAFQVLTFYGYLDVDGRLHAYKDGPVGVRLPANDPVFGLERLEYRVDWDLRTPGGQPVIIDHGFFEAPSTDVTIYLSDVLLTTGSGSVPLPAGPSVIDGGFPDSMYEDVVDGGIG